MLKEIGSYDAKTRLPEILRRVEAGEVFTITKHGKPIADLVPSKSAANFQTETAIANILKAKRHRLSDSLLRELKDAGRK
jgi:prevent-host-death family protein